MVADTRRSVSCKQGRPKTLDKLEGYFGPGNPENGYERKTIAVQLEDEVVNAFVYFVANSRPHLQELQDGLSETVTEYTQDMAKSEVKPGFEAP